MFTGIVREVGRMGPVARRGQSLRMCVLCAATAEDAAPGDSVAVNGVCLTVAAKAQGRLFMDVGEETFRRTSLADARPGDAVNVEPSLRIGDKLGGHIVTGHVDAVGRVAARREETTQAVLEVSFPESLRALIVPKGSVALDGVSLTVGAVGHGRFETYLIPHTAANTTFRDRRPGDAVNIEADILARYAQGGLHAGAEGKPEGIEELLKKFEYTP